MVTRRLRGVDTRRVPRSGCHLTADKHRGTHSASVTKASRSSASVRVRCELTDVTDGSFGRRAVTVPRNGEQRNTRRAVVDTSRFAAPRP